MALIVGLFAVLFAPGALDNPTNSAPEDVAAAVLAPTSADLATVAPAVEREVRVASVLGTLVALALVVARRPRRLIRAERWPWQRVDTGPGVFRRRGPPLSFT